MLTIYRRQFAQYSVYKWRKGDKYKSNKWIYLKQFDTHEKAKRYIAKISKKHMKEMLTNFPTNTRNIEYMIELEKHTFLTYTPQKGSKYDPHRNNWKKNENYKMKEVK